MELEYVAATHSLKEAIWLRALIGELFDELKEPTTLNCDNQSVIVLTKDGQFHTQMKHIDVQYHFIRWVCQRGDISIVYCPADKIVADVLTKPLPSLKVKHFANVLDLRTV